MANQNKVLKALLNPASPWILLPQNLFKLVADKWMKSFKDFVPWCGDSFCYVTSPCSKVPYLDDFGIKLGSLNDTKPEG